MWRYLCLYACTASVETSVAYEKETRSGGDIVHVALHIDIANYTGVGRYAIASPGLQEVWLAVSELHIDGVTDDSGQPLDHVLENGRLVLPAQGDTTFVTIAYRFNDAAENASGLGYSAEGRGAMTWPVHCDALYPCHPSPADGIRYSLEVVGAPAVYAASLDFEGPPYMLSFATGDFRTIEETTTAGTRVRYYLETVTPEKEESLRRVRDAFDWYERTLGPYVYGDVVGGVEVAPPIGCMEHHPFWHCTDEGSQIHEAAHGWFGNAVRIACWEDIFITEGITEYLAQRVRHDGQWDVDASLAKPGKNGVWKSGKCTWSRPGEQWEGAYTNGPEFLKTIANAIGLEQLDAALSTLFKQQLGQPTRVEDFLNVLQTEADFDARALAHTWLE